MPRLSAKNITSMPYLPADLVFAESVQNINYSPKYCVKTEKRYIRNNVYNSSNISKKEGHGNSKVTPKRPIEVMLLVGCSRSSNSTRLQGMRVFCRLRFQPVDATHWLNRSAGVS